MLVIYALLLVGLLGGYHASKRLACGYIVRHVMGLMMRDMHLSVLEMCHLIIASMSLDRRLMSGL